MQVQGQDPSLNARKAMQQQASFAGAPSGASSPQGLTAARPTESAQKPGFGQGGATNAFAQAATMPSAGSGIDFGAIAKIGAPQGIPPSQAVGPTQATARAIDLTGNGAQVGGLASIPGGGMSQVGTKFMARG